MLGGIAQLALVYWAIRRAGFVPRIRWPRLDPEVRRFWVLAMPAIIAGGITQINIFVGTIIASGADEVMSIIYNADRLYQLPLGIIGIAIGTVLLPELSRHLERRPRGRGAPEPEPVAVPLDAAVAAGRRRADRAGPADGARAVRARRLRPDRQRPRLAGADRLRRGAARLRADPRAAAGLLLAPGHEDPDLVRRHLAGGQRRALARAVRQPQACRHRACDLDRRLGQRGAARRLPRQARPFHADRAASGGSRR